MKEIFTGLLFIFLFPSQVLAQGDGPRSSLAFPTGLTGLSVKWLWMEQNLVPSGTIFRPDASVKVSVFPIAVYHSFRIGKQAAQVIGAIVPGSTSGLVQTQVPGGGGISFKSSGWADGFLGFKLALMGNPARNLTEFASSAPRFSMHGFIRYWYSGTYRTDKAISMGTNRQTLHFSLPMAIPFGKNKKQPFWLEITPGFELYTKNRNPNSVSGGQVITQLPVASLESHLTKNLTPKFWAGIGQRYYYGGETFLDEIGDNNKMSVLALGLILGYQFTPALGGSLTYANVVYGYQNAAIEMFRFGISYNFYRK
jgi:hypothetical protein